MTALFEMSLNSETLTDDELREITGCSRASDQLKWLEANGWLFHISRANSPIVGRLYARMKMAGINNELITTRQSRKPDFSSLNSSR